MSSIHGSIVTSAPTSKKFFNLQWHHLFSHVCISRRQCVRSRSIRWLLLLFLKTENRMRQSPVAKLTSTIQKKKKNIQSTATYKNRPTHTRGPLVRRVEVNGELAALPVCRWSVSLFFTCLQHFRSIAGLASGAHAVAVPSRRTHTMCSDRARNNTSVWNVAKSRRRLIFSLCQKLFIPLSLSLVASHFSCLHLLVFVHLSYAHRASATPWQYSIYFNCANRTSGKKKKQNTKVCDRLFRSPVLVLVLVLLYVEIQNKPCLSVQLNDNATSVNKTESRRTRETQTDKMHCKEAIAIVPLLLAFIDTVYSEGSVKVIYEWHVWRDRLWPNAAERVIIKRNRKFRVLFLVLDFRLPFLATWCFAISMDSHRNSWIFHVWTGYRAHYATFSLCESRTKFALLSAGDDALFLHWIHS